MTLSVKAYRVAMACYPWARPELAARGSLEPGPTLVDMVTTGFGHHINKGWAWFEAKPAATHFLPGCTGTSKGKGKGKGNYLTSVSKQAKTAFLHGPTVRKSPIVGIEPAKGRKRCTNHCTTGPHTSSR